MARVLYLAVLLLAVVVASCVAQESVDAPADRLNFDYFYLVRCGGWGLEKRAELHPTSLCSRALQQHTPRAVRDAIALRSQSSLQSPL